MEVFLLASLMGDIDSPIYSNYQDPATANSMYLFSHMKYSKKGFGGRFLAHSLPYFMYKIVSNQLFHLVLED